MCFRIVKIFVRMSAMAVALKLPWRCFVSAGPWRAGEEKKSLSAKEEQKHSLWRGRDKRGKVNRHSHQPHRPFRVGQINRVELQRRRQRNQQKASETLLQWSLSGIFFFHLSSKTPPSFSIGNATKTSALHSSINNTQLIALCPQPWASTSTSSSSTARLCPV